MTTSPISGCRATSKVQRSIVFAAIAAIPLAITGCTASKAPETRSSTPPPQSAAQVCQGALDSAAARRLQEISGTRRFTSEVPETVGSIANHIRAELSRSSGSSIGEEHIACKIYWGECTDDTCPLNAYTPAEFTFNLYRPPSGFQHRSTEKDTHYDVADGASGSGNSGSIFFHCPIKNEKGIVNLANISADLYVPKLVADDPNLRESNLHLIHAFSLKLVKSLGCLDTGNLPKQLGKMKAYPVETG